MVKQASLQWNRLRRRVTQPTPNGPITLATVRDPDGLLVLLTPGSITRPDQGNNQVLPGGDRPPASAMVNGRTNPGDADQHQQEEWQSWT